MKKQCIVWSFIFFCSTFFSSCATPPPVSRQKTELYQQKLDAAHRRFLRETFLRVYSVSYKILLEENGKYAALPLYLISNAEKSNLMVVGVLSGFGINSRVQLGDALIALQGVQIRNAFDLERELQISGHTKKLTLTFQNSAGSWNEEFPVLRLLRKPNIDVVENASIVNAYADLSNNVVIFTGMTRFIQSDDELAFILAHEFGHVEKKHPLKSLPSKMGATIAGAAIGSLVGGATAPQLGDLSANLTTGILQSPYSVLQEKEADDFAAKRLYKAGFDCGKAAKLWERMAVEKTLTMDKSFLATHPTSVERFTALKKLETIETAPAALRGDR